MPPDLVSPPARTDETERLISHILTRYHQTHREDFPAAITLARQVERDHASNGLCPAGVADHLAAMFDHLESHQQREERILFPTLLAGGCAAARFPIMRMMAEHEDVEGELAVLADLSFGGVAPDDASEAWRELYRLCAKLRDDLREHMRLENEELFAPYLS